MTALGKKTFFAPMVEMLLSSLQPGPIFTCGPTTQNGPISTDSWISAFSSTTACGLILGCSPLKRRNQARRGSVGAPTVAPAWSEPLVARPVATAVGLSAACSIVGENRKKDP